MSQRRTLVRRILSALTAISCLNFPFFLPSAVRAAPLVVIGEVAWAGSSMSTADEWIELWNLGETEVDLGGYALWGASEDPLLLPARTVVSPGKAFLLTNYAAEDEKSALIAVPNIVTPALSLSNTKLALVLKDANGVEIDRAGDGGTPPAGMSGENKISMVKSADGWINATSSVGFDEEQPDLGTPGYCDDCPSISAKTPLAEQSAIMENETLMPEETLTASTTQILPTDATTTESFAPTSTCSVCIEDGVDMGILDAATSTEFFVATSTPAETIADIPDIVQTATGSSDIPAVEIPSATNTAIFDNPSTYTSQTAQNQPIVVPDQPVATPEYSRLRLNELMPRPMDEHEWVEIALAGSSTVPLMGLGLFDAAGKIYAFSTGTLDGANPRIRVFLKSARLNNKGDSVSLKDPDGNALDAFSYIASAPGKTWARFSDTYGEWQADSSPTPGETNAENVLEPDEDPTETEVLLVVTSEEKNPEPLPAVREIEMPPASPPPLFIEDKSQTEVKMKKTINQTKKTVAAADTPNKPITTKKPAVSAQIKTKKPTTAPKIPLTLDMIANISDGGLRVSLKGVVGSQPGLLPNHGFVLLSPDGRGLLVRLPAARRMPAYGSTIMIAGILTFDDNNIPLLKAAASDNWQTLSEARQTPVPRLIPLVVPGAEDAWSLTSVTGTVQEIRANSFVLDTSDGEMTVVIKPEARYRTSRLSRGDTIAVTGLLDISVEVPRILPRLSGEIVLAKHAAPKTEPKDGLPDWLPLGAAGMAVAGTEGARHLNRRRRQRALEKTLEKGVNAK